MPLFEASFRCFNREVSSDSSAGFFLTIRDAQMKPNDIPVIDSKRGHRVFTIDRTVDIQFLYFTFLCVSRSNPANIRFLVCYLLSSYSHQKNRPFDL